MIVEKTIQRAICNKCKFEWNLHKVIPKKCGRCQSKHWNDDSSIIPKTKESSIGLFTTLKKKEKEEVTWIELAPTYQDGDILYWHKLPKQQPICYRRERDLTTT